MTSIDTSLMYSSVENKVREANGNLDKDDFLKLLITQLQNQDPTSPMDDTAFVSQMATFSSLEQMSNMNSVLESMLQSQTENLLLGYSQFVGKEITYHNIRSDDGLSNGAIQEGKGTVAAVQFNSGKAEFTLEDGTVLSPANISSLNASNSEHRPNLAEASRLIGRNVTWLDDQQKEAAAAVLSVFLKDGQLSLEVNDEKKSILSIDQLIRVS